MKFSIIIPYYNGEKYLYNCLDSIFKKSQIENYEIIVIDDHSKEEISDSIKKKFSSVKYFNNKKNLGFVRTCNRGARESKGELLVFLNMDTVIDTKNWLGIIEKTFERDKKIGIVGVKLVYPELNLVQTAGDEINPGSFIPSHLYKFAPTSYPDVNKYRELDMVTGAALTIRKDLFKMVGGFSEEFISVFEDCDLCLQIRSHNYKVVYQPLVSIFHYETVTGVSEVMSFKSYLIFYKKWEKYILKKKRTMYESDGYNDSFIRRLLSLYFKNFNNIIFTINKLKLKSEKNQKDVLKFKDEEIIDLIIKKIHIGEETYLSDFLYYKMINSLKDGRRNQLIDNGFQSIKLNPNSIYSDTIKIIFWMMDKRKKCNMNTFKNEKNFEFYLFLDSIENSENTKKMNYNLIKKHNIVKTIQFLILLIEVISFNRLKKYINFVLNNIIDIENINYLISFLFLILYKKNSYRKDEILKTINLLIEKYDWPDFKRIQFFINLGSYYEKENEMDRAEQYFKMVIVADTKSEFLSSAYFHLGVCNMKKNINMAKSYFSKCLEITPGHFKAVKLLRSLNS